LFVRAGPAMPAVTAPALFVRAAPGEITSKALFAATHNPAAEGNARRLFRLGAKRRSEASLRFLKH